MPVRWNPETSTFDLEVEIYPSADGFRWRYRADNGEITQAAHEGFTTRRACRENVTLHRADILKSDAIRWVEVDQ